jgi:type II secretory pathway pseudopilin PulG
MTRRGRRLRPRRGAALLEAIVALAVFGTAGSAALVLVRDATRAVEHAREAEARVRDADAFMHAVSLWTRDDLDRRLGERAQGAWRLVIQRPNPSVYEIVLRDTLSDAVLLSTALHRATREAVDAAR